MKYSIFGLMLLISSFASAMQQNNQNNQNSQQNSQAPAAPIQNPQPNNNMSWLDFSNNHPIAENRPHIIRTHRPATQVSRRYSNLPINTVAPNVGFNNNDNSLRN